jgi:hypothetical protein
VESRTFEQLFVDPSMRRAVLAWRQARADIALGRFADALTLPKRVA